MISPTIYDINWMDCTMLKKCGQCQITRANFFGSFSVLCRFWLLITISTDHYQYRSDPSYRQLQLFLLLRMVGSSKMAENWPNFFRSVAIRAVNPVYINNNASLVRVQYKILFKKEAKLVMTSFSFVYFQIRIYIF